MKFGNFLPRFASDQARLYILGPCNEFSLRVEKSRVVLIILSEDFFKDAHCIHCLRNTLINHTIVFVLYKMKKDTCLDKLDDKDDKFKITLRQSKKVIWPATFDTETLLLLDNSDQHGEDKEKKMNALHDNKFWKRINLALPNPVSALNDNSETDAANVTF